MPARTTTIFWCAVLVGLWLPSSACVFRAGDRPGQGRVTCDDGAPCGPGQICVVDAASVGRCFAAGTPCIDEGPPARFAEDGTLCSTDADICLAGQCVKALCGDDVLTLAHGEQCDDGADNSDEVPGACRTDCSRPHCGDGVIDDGERCDDGNTASADGCRLDCQKVEVCGDGIVDDGEHCDDENDNPRDGCAECQRQQWVTVLAVSGSLQDRPATSTSLDARAVAVDVLGRSYVAGDHQVWRLELDGMATSIAGNGVEGFSGDGGPATSAQVRRPRGVAVDPLGRVVFADSGNHRVRRIELDGTLVTVAGNGLAGFSGDGGAATQASLNEPQGIAVDRFGRVLIADSGNHRIRRIDDDGTLTTLVALVVDQQQPTLSAAQAVAVDDEGRVLIADAMHHRVWRVGSDGALRSIAGTGVFGFSGTGGPAVQAELGAPFGVAVDPLGRVLVVELHHGVVRRIEQDGTLRVVAGTGELAEPCDAAVVDGGPATAALLQAPRGVAVDRQGRVLTADTGSGRVRRVELDGTITTVAGTGTLGLLGDGGPADSAALRFPQDVVVDSEGRLVIADGFHDRLRRVGTDGVITTIAGTGDDLFFRSDVAFVDDLCPASRTGVEFPRAVVVDDVGRVLFIDGSNRIRRIEPDNRIVTVAGTGSFGRAGDGGPATAADLGFPRGLVIDDGGRVIFADTDNHVVRRIDEDGLVHTIAGTGTAAFLGDGGPATSAGLQSPFGLAVDALGRVIVADSGNHAVRRLETDGTITTLAGVGFPGFAVDGGPAETAALQLPRGVAVDADGRVLVAECLNNVVRRIEHDGTLVIVAGTGGRGFSGDGGPARAALFDCPQGLDVDAEGRVIVADTGNHRVRRIERDGTVTTVAGEAHPAGPGPAGRARLYPAEALALLPTHELVAVGGFGRAMRLDLRAGVVDVVVGYEGAAPGVAAQARFAPPLRQSRGAVFDPGALTLLFSERDAPGVRVVDVDVDDDQVIDDPSSWTSRTLSTGLTSPAGFAHDPATDTFVVADDDEHCVQRIDRDGRVLATVLGRCGAAGRLPGFLHRPTHVAVSPVSGALYVADTGNHRVLRKDGDVVTVVVGDGSVSSAGEGSPARLFPVQAPGQLALDRFGNLYVASTTTVRMVANIDGDRDADGDDDVRTLFGGGDRSTYPESDAFCLRALAVDEDAVYVSDACQGFVVRLSPAAQP